MVSRSVGPLTKRARGSYYNALQGQAACRPCSSSSVSGPGSAACVCKGKYRSFQMSDGYCVCAPGCVVECTCVCVCVCVCAYVCMCVTAIGVW